LPQEVLFLRGMRELDQQMSALGRQRAAHS
jgi:hypothetical protein